MNAEEFKSFLSSLKNTDIEELRLEAGETKIFFRRNNVPVFTSLPGTSAAKSAEKMAAKEDEKKLVPIKSPMVGTFYHSDSSDRPPFVMEGNHITPGQKIGIIETMKIMKDVTSSVKGKIVKVLITNGHPVEYGQELFLIDTEDAK